MGRGLFQGLRNGFANIRDFIVQSNSERGNSLFRVRPHLSQLPGSRQGLASMASNAGLYALGWVLVLALLSVPILLIFGSVWLGERLLPWLMLLSAVTLLVLKNPG